MKTSQRQTSPNGGAKSMFSQEGFLASLSPSQEKERAQTTTAISGHRCYELYGRSGQVGSCVRTLLESRRWWSPCKRLRWVAQMTYSRRVTYTERKAGTHSKESARTLKTLDIPSRRSIFQLAVSELPTEENASGLLPTVQTQGLKRCNEEGKTEYYPMQLLPTALDRGSGRINRSLSENAADRPTLALAAREGLLPTRDHVSGEKKTSGRPSQLNPLYVEEMMGFPFGWTVYPFLSESGDKKA